MIPAQFKLISVTPFVPPTHRPGILVIPPGTTQHMATTLCKQHKDSIHIFRPGYLYAIRNYTTTANTGPVNNIIDHLSTTYGHVTAAQMFDDREDEVRKMIYNPTTHPPIHNLFTALDNLVDFTELAHNNITQRQCVTRAYIILNKSGRFVEAIKTWNRLAPAQQNWISFKAYFRGQAHTEHHKTTNLTLEQANMEQRQDALLVQQIMEGVQAALPQQSQTNTDELMTEVANVASVVNQQSQVIPQLMQQMQQMQQMMQQMTFQQPPAPQYHQYQQPPAPYQQYQPQYHQQHQNQF